MAIPAHSRLQMYFSTTRLGWSERLDFDSNIDTALTAITVAGGIIDRRMNILPYNATLDWARVVNTDSPRDAASVLPSYPRFGDYGFVEAGIGGAPPADPSEPNEFGVNRTSDALLIRLESRPSGSPGAKWCNRWIHGIPDEIMSLDNIVGAVPDLTGTAAAYTRFAATGDWLTRLANYLITVKAVTKIPAGSVLVAPTGIFVRKAGGHKVGRPFGLERGRVSR